MARRGARWRRRCRLLSFISRRNRDLGDLGRSRASGWTCARRGLRELMSIITPSRRWRGVWRAGSASATYSPFVSGRDCELDDLGRSRARGWTWTRRGLRELMSIITPSRPWARRGARWQRRRRLLSFISGRDRDLGDLGRSRASGWTWTRRGLRELMSIISLCLKALARRWARWQRRRHLLSLHLETRSRSRAISGDLERTACGALAAPPPPTLLHLETRSRSRRSRAISSERLDMDSTWSA